MARKLLRCTICKDVFSGFLGKLSNKHSGTTKKKSALIIVIMLPAYPAYGDGEDQIVVGIVNKALEFFKAQGKDQALKIVGASARAFEERCTLLALRWTSKTALSPTRGRNTCGVRMRGNSRTRRENSARRTSSKSQRNRARSGVSIGGSG